MLAIIILAGGAVGWIVRTVHDTYKDTTIIIDVVDTGPSRLDKWIFKQ